MARSVSFAPELVSECHHIPRMAKDKIPDYYYSRRDIERFQRIWKSIILQKMKQVEERRDSPENGKKRTQPRSSNEEEHVTSAKRRKVCLAIDEQKVDTIVRSVSPVDDQVVSR